jgi:hypothetical protein
MCDALQIYGESLGRVPPFIQISNVGICAEGQLGIRKPISARSGEPPSCKLSHGDLLGSDRKTLRREHPKIMSGKMVREEAYDVGKTGSVRARSFSNLA